jgi:hypothetical protein
MKINFQVLPRNLFLVPPVLLLQCVQIDMPMECCSTLYKSCHQNSRQTINMKLANKSFENLTRFKYLGTTVKKKLRGFGLLANYPDRATAASWRSSTNFCGQRVLRGQRNGSPRSYSRFS